MDPYFVITKYSHFFSVTNIQPSAIGILLKFSVKYVHRTFAKENGKTVLKPNKVYATRIANREFRFHIGQYDDFIKTVSYEGLSPEYYQIIEKPLYEPATFVSKINPKFEEREYQTNIIKFLTVEEIGDNRSRLVGLQTGGGKGQVLDALIKVPGGWSTMGEMKVGTVVTAGDGTSAEVDGVYPQGIKPIYKITFEDKRSVKCDHEHLWKIFIDRTPAPLIVSAFELPSLINKYHVSIPTSVSELIDDVKLPIHPFLAGQDIDRLTPKDRLLYKNSSDTQRTLFAKGILSTVKIFINHNTIIVETDSNVKISFLQYLIRSLGGLATLSQSNLDNKAIYTLHISINHPERFSEKVELRDIEYNQINTIAISSIEPAGYEETQCISIDHPDHLYITNDFIVTHNTFCALSATSKLATRTLIIVLPKYLEKWQSDITNILDVKPKEVLPIRGGKELKSLMMVSSEQDIEAKYILISLTTMQSLFNDFKDNGDGILDLEYPYLPEELCERLRIGTVIFDEVHQQLYSVFRALLHIHVPKVIALSATLISDDHFIDQMQHTMFPKEIRYNKVPINKYVKVNVYSYGFKDRELIKRIRTSVRGSNTYNQIEFEKSIARHPVMLKNYLDMIVRLLKMNYIDNKKENDTAIVFAGSIDMCTRITERLKKEFPTYDIRRYVEDDPYENVIEADIRVSTILSAGTAVDIPNLRIALMTNSIQSPISILQALGRLRQLIDRDVTFCYMYNFHVPKQVDYHYRKKELFADRVVTFKEFRLEEGI